MISLDIFIGIVFLCAGLIRIICRKCRSKELVFLGLQSFSIMSYLIIIYELYLGYYFITNKYKHNKKKSNLLLKSLLYLLPITMILLFINNYKKIYNSFIELFTYQPTSISLFLHITYFIIIFHLYKKINN